MKKKKKNGDKGKTVMRQTKSKFYREKKGYYLLVRAEEVSDFTNKKKIYFLAVTHQNFHLELCA